ncbi:MAG: ABC transporter permease [Candidatus Cloacimonetes bacterium]|nr:ABC transporter permease [Candidatus Cloacimonadota bacterium]
MLKNYFRSASTSLLKNKGFTLINLLSLSIGITGIFLVYILISHEQSFDRYHENNDRIFRVLQREMMAGGKSMGVSTAPPLAEELKSTVPGIEEVCRVLFLSDRLVSSAEFSDYEKQFVLVDPAFFKIFSVPVLNGNVARAIEGRDNVIITRRIAEKYYNDLDIIGKSIKIRDKDYNIGGVIENPPSYSHLQYDILCTMNLIDNEAFHKSAWLWHAINTYIKIQPAADWEDVDEKIRYLRNEEALGQFKDAGLDYTFSLQPLTRIRQEEVTENGIITSASARNVTIFQLLAVFVLILACLNFINLTLALYWRRIKEVSIRKIIGARSKDLARQFLFETFIVIILAVLISVALIEVSLPCFLNFIGIPASFLQQISFFRLILFLVTMVLIGLLAGTYPAIYTSRHGEIKIIGSMKSKRSNSLIRPILIVVQFKIAVVIMVVLFNMQKQVKFMQSRDLGFDLAHKLVVKFRSETNIKEKFETYKKIFSRLPGVKAVTASNTIPGKVETSFYIESNDEKTGKVQKTMNCFSIDHDFLPIYQIKLSAGRNFDPAIDHEPERVFLISESGARLMGWEEPRDALGKEIITGNQGRKGQIVGIIKDFNYMSLQYAISPIFLEYFPRDFTYLTLYLENTDLTGTIGLVEQTWKTEFTGIPCEYFFADDSFNLQYINEMRAITLIKFFGLVAITIACSGLVGISLFVTQQRIREISIRKILGASLLRLLYLLNFRFMLLVGAANLIAWPIAYYTVQKWLQNFVYRINFPVGTLFSAGFLALMISYITISTVTLKVAGTNPVSVLKYE